MVVSAFPAVLVFMETWRQTIEVNASKALRVSKALGDGWRHGDNAASIVAKYDVIVRAVFAGFRLEQRTSHFDMPPNHPGRAKESAPPPPSRRTRHSKIEQKD
jgi:hypothetical protein